MKLDNEINFLVLGHTHFKVLDTLELLRFLLDWEILVLSNDSLSEFYHFIGVGGGEKTVLGCNIYLAERLLKLVEALMIRLLLE